MLSPSLDLEEADLIPNALSKGTPILKIILKVLFGFSKTLELLLCRPDLGEPRF